MWTSTTVLWCLIIYLKQISCYNVYILDFQNNSPVSENMLVSDDSRPSKQGIITTNDVALVKRLVPLGYKTPQFEYDTANKRIFVPKYRIHKRRPVRNEEIFKDLYKLFYRPIYGNENPLDVLKVMPQNGRHFKKGLRDDVPDAEYDPADAEPGGGRPKMVPVQNKKKQNHFNFPHFSLYDYWTMGKILFQDRCPPHQAKLGKTCVYAPMA